MNRFVIPASIGLLVSLAAATPALAQQASTHHHGTKHHSSTSHAASKWHESYRDNTVVVAVDPARTTRRPDGTYSTRLRWAYAADQPIGRGRAYRTMTETLLLDCAGLRTKPLSGETFDRHGGKVSSFDTPSGDTASLDWLARDPKSTGGKALAKVCHDMPQS